MKAIPSFVRSLAVCATRDDMQGVAYQLMYLEILVSSVWG